MVNDTPMVKICRICQQEKAISEFYKHRTNKDGYRNDCKSCNLRKRGHEPRFIVPDGMKRCTTCKQVLLKTSDNFSKDRSSKDGLAARCKACQRQIDRRSYLSHRDTDEYKRKNRSKSRTWYQANSERANLTSKAYYEANKETILEKGRIYLQSHKEQSRISHQNWVRKNPQKRKAISKRYLHQRRAILNSLPSTFTDADWQRCKAYWSGCCAVCGRQGNDLFSTHTLAQDHWIALTDPRPDNPGNVPANVVPLCHGLNGCNNSKSNRDAAEWLREKFGTRKADEILARIQAYFDAISD